MNDLEQRASKIKLAAFDVDGVMTDGSITYDENGIEYKTFNAKDGHGITMLNNAGIITAIITARSNGTVQHRAENLKFKEIHQGSKNKIQTLTEILEKYNLTLEQTAYMGDDLPDICILEKAGLRVPRDISIVGIDNSSLAQFCSVPLTSVRNPVRVPVFYIPLMAISKLRSSCR